MYQPVGTNSGSNDVHALSLFEQKVIDTMTVFGENDPRISQACFLAFLIHRIYTGQDSLGWAYFDKNYVFADKEEMRRTIQDFFDTSSVYRE